MLWRGQGVYADGYPWPRNLGYPFEPQTRAFAAQFDQDCANKLEMKSTFPCLNCDRPAHVRGGQPRLYCSEEC
jgi:hypothetical protein